MKEYILNYIILQTLSFLLDFTTTITRTQPNISQTEYYGSYIQYGVDIYWDYINNQLEKYNNIMLACDMISNLLISARSVAEYIVNKSLKSIEEKMNVSNNLYLINAILQKLYPNPIENIPVKDNICKKRENIISAVINCNLYEYILFINLNSLSQIEFPPEYDANIDSKSMYLGKPALDLMNYFHSNIKGDSYKEYLDALFKAFTVLPTSNYKLRDQVYILLLYIYYFIDY